MSLKNNSEGHNFLENAKFMSGLANGYFLFKKMIIFYYVTFFCCLRRVFMCLELKNTSLTLILTGSEGLGINAHIDELWSGIVCMASLWESVRKTRLTKILVLKYLHTKLVHPKLSLSCTMSYVAVTKYDDIGTISNVRYRTRFISVGISNTKADSAFLIL